MLKQEAVAMKEINIPVGISDFKEIRKNGYYYVDKTFLIKDYDEVLCMVFHFSRSVVW